MKYKLGMGLLAIAYAAMAHAEVNETIDYRYYEIQDPALSELSLRQSLDAATPFSRDGGALHGKNQWDILWHVWKDESETGCAVKDVKVDLDTLIILPELVSEADATQQAFNTYVKALQQHLVAHYVVAIQAANAIERGLINLDSAPNCDLLDERADELAEEVIERHRQKERAFDEMTRFGAEQGVVLGE